MSDFEERETTIASSWDEASTTSATSASFDRVDGDTDSYDDSDVTTTDGSPFYLVEEGTDDYILTEDLDQILLGYWSNWKEINTKISQWTRSNFTE